MELTPQFVLRHEVSGRLKHSLQGLEACQTQGGLLDLCVAFHSSVPLVRAPNQTACKLMFHLECPLRELKNGTSEGVYKHLQPKLPFLSNPRNFQPSVQRSWGDRILRKSRLLPTGLLGVLYALHCDTFVKPQLKSQTRPAGSKQSWRSLTFV